MSTRNIHVNIASYTLLVAGKKKYTGEEWDVLEFSSLTELKKYRKSHPEKSKRLVRTVLIFTESSDQLSRATDRVPGLPASPGYVQ